jgi:hypothetical protein
LAIGPSLGGCEGWVPNATPGAARITLEQIARWHAQQDKACLRVTAAGR